MTFPSSFGTKRLVLPAFLAIGWLIASVMPAVAQQPEAEPLLTVYHLQFIGAPEASNLLAEVFPGDEVRVATDPQTNSLIVSAPPELQRELQALLQSLDRDDIRRTKPDFQPVQVRVFWLVSAPGGSAPHDMLKPVIDELSELGITDLKLAGRMSIHVGRGGRPFTVSSRPIVSDQNFVFSFEGVISGQPDGAPVMEARIKCLQPELESDRPFASLDTNIEAPLNQFIVLGTTVAAGADSVFVLQLVPRSPPTEKK